MEEGDDGDGGDGGKAVEALGGGWVWSCCVTYSVIKCVLCFGQFTSSQNVMLACRPVSFDFQQTYSLTQG